MFLLAFATQVGIVNGSIELLAPAMSVSTQSDHLYIVGRTDAPMVELHLNGRLFSEVVVKDSVFHKRISFGYGLNEIEVQPVYGGRTEGHDPLQLQILSGPDIARKYRKSFPNYKFHVNDAPKACLSCHDSTLPHSQNTIALEDDETCFSCHADSKVTFRTHIKNDKRACIFCHTLTPELTVVQTGTYSDENPCYKCHKDKIGEFEQEFVHGPVAGGSCTICHNPHGTEFKKNLNVPEAILCTACHNDIEDQLKSKVLHQPFRDGRCSSCHDPHATNNKWVLVQRSEDLCLKCHGTTKEGMAFHRHPYNVEPKRPLMKDLQLTDRGTLECLSCHNPHGNETAHMLRVSQGNTCLGCHPDR